MEMQRQWTGSHPMDLKLWELQLDKQDGLSCHKESNIDQIRIFADQSIKRNYNGLLLTLWDDDSPHFELYKRGIHAFAEFSWAGLSRTKEEFKKHTDIVNLEIVFNQINTHLSIYLTSQ